MFFDDDWSEILLQKALLNQKLSNFLDASPSLVNTEMFIMSYGYRQTKLGFKVKISFVFLGMLVF